MAVYDWNRQFVSGCLMLFGVSGGTPLSSTSHRATSSLRGAPGPLLDFPPPLVPPTSKLDCPRQCTPAPSNSSSGSFSRLRIKRSKSGRVVTSRRVLASEIFYVTYFAQTLPGVPVDFSFPDTHRPSSSCSIQGRRVRRSLWLWRAAGGGATPGASRPSDHLPPSL